MFASFSHKQDELGNITTFYFAPLGPFRYIAGQFIELTLPHDNPDNRGQKRWYTLSSSPTSSLLSITTRLTEGGSSFKQALRSLQKGDAVTMSEPMGDFVLPKSIQTPLVFVAAGIGITPYLSMSRWLAENGEKRPIRLIYGVTTEDDIIGQEIIDAAGLHSTIAVSNPSDAWGGERGHLTPQMILGVEEPSADTQIYLSGPEKFVTSLTSGLKLLGVGQNQLVTDYFPGYDT